MEWHKKNFRAARHKTVLSPAQFRCASCAEFDPEVKGRLECWSQFSTTMADGHANRAEGDVDRHVLHRFFPGKQSCVLVEVGAARPDSLSISASFRALGWRVVSIEPNPEFCELHRARGYEVLEYACGDHDEDNVEFCIVDSHGIEHEGAKLSYESFSSLAIKESYARLKSDLDIRRIKVKLRRLDTILAEHAPDVSSIDILALDVEGWELEVLDGLNFERYRPQVLIVENLFNDPRYWSYMRARGYSLWRNKPPNDVYSIDSLGPFERLLSIGYRSLRMARRFATYFHNC